MKKYATAVWNGSGKEGSGQLTSESNALNNTKYSYATRFTDEKGSNPEELIAAAHAGCFCMKLSFVLGEAGFTPDSLEARATVTLESSGITGSALSLKAKVPGISPEKFKECTEAAKNECPVSKALNVPVTLESALV